MTFGDMEDDRARLEQYKISFFISRNLPEWMKPAMCGFLHSVKRNKANVIGLAHFFERPANPHIPGQSPTLIGGVLEGGYDGAHLKAPG